MGHWSGAGEGRESRGGATFACAATDRLVDSAADPFETAQDALDEQSQWSQAMENWRTLQERDLRGIRGRTARRSPSQHLIPRVLPVLLLSVVVKTQAQLLHQALSVGTVKNQHKCQKKKM